MATIGHVAVGVSAAKLFTDQRSATRSSMLWWAALSAFALPVFRTQRVRAVVFATGVLASHGLLDTVSSGWGCALLWPFTDARFAALAWALRRQRRSQ